MAFIFYRHAITLYEAEHCIVRGAGAPDFWGTVSAVDVRLQLSSS